VHAACASNIALDWEDGDLAASQAAFAHAHHVASVDLADPPMTACALEPKAALAQWDETSQRMTLVASTQGVMLVRKILAEHVFKLAPEQVRVVLHPQSIIHSMVVCRDNSVLAQLGTPDMRVPIAHALAWPERIETPVERLDLARIGKLEFEEADRERFPALALAEAALREGGCRPCILNAANEEAVAAFLSGRIGFLDIASVVADTLSAIPACCPDTLGDVDEADRRARALAQQALEIAQATQEREFAAELMVMLGDAEAAKAAAEAVARQAG
jgi:1-deoxy-D-xylulose 5-phosphate reductoisomerase